MKEYYSFFREVVSRRPDTLVLFLRKGKKLQRAININTLLGCFFFYDYFFILFAYLLFALRPSPFALRPSLTPPPTY